MSSTAIIVTTVIVAAVFGILWYQGQIRRFSVYCQETWEELKKCSWPSWTELKGSTTLVALTIALLGIFVIAVDEVFFNVFFKLLK
ncbi:MAG TPA: preprotein translocase subunit SecE [Candidatus Baltobacteraceae bacterium]|nr:preprotein translocase subunit SecE [Candidatus Baltobacteraceae bacterium]